jgi:hypothetical protein
MIVRMAEQIKQLPLNIPDDFNKMVDVLDKLDDIIHRHRGTAIGGNGERKSPISLEAFRAYQRTKRAGTRRPHDDVHAPGKAPRLGCQVIAWPSASDFR